MTVDTNNYYGNISISNDSIAVVAGYYALDCPGVVELVPTSLKENLRELFRRARYSKGIEITARSNRIGIDIYCVLKYGVSISAVAESLKNTVKYRVEKFTGMLVDEVNVHVVGVRV